MQQIANLTTVSIGFHERKKIDLFIINFLRLGILTLFFFLSIENQWKQWLDSLFVSCNRCESQKTAFWGPASIIAYM